MTSLTCTIEPDELLGLNALAELDRAAAGTGTGAVPTAQVRAGAERATLMYQ